MPYECGASCLLNGASCLLNVASCLLNAGSTCLRTSFLWGELSWGDLSLGGIVRNRTVQTTSFKLMSLGIDIYTHLYSRLLWQRGRVSDCHPGDQRSPTLGTKRDR